MKLNSVQAVGVHVVAFSGALLLSGLAGAGRAAGAGNPVSVAQVERAWRARTDGLETARFTWRSQPTYTKGSMGFDPGNPQPPRDVTFEIPAVNLWLDGSGIRYETKLPDFDAVLSGEDLPDFTSTFDGRDSMALSPNSNREYLRGTIFDTEVYNDAENLFISAILLWYAPLRPGYGVIEWSQGAELTRDYSISAERPVVGGRRCVVMQQRVRSGQSLRNVFWLDPERDFLVVRSFQYVDGRVGTQVEIDYRRDERWGWVPSEWEAAFLFSNGTLNQSARATVTEYAINEPISPDIFRLTFAPGTWVTDMKRNESFIVRENGQKRIVTEQEVIRPGVTYADLVATESGMAGLAPASSSNWWLLVAAAVVVAVVLLLGARRGRSFG